MTFMNWVMLAGVLAFSVPLIIHLFNRSKFKVVEWGAMHLLHSVVRVNRKRIKIEQLILLLIRCAIPAILALVMARPVITGWRTLAGDAPTSTVVLLDASYSMGAGGAGRTNFASAQEQTTRILSKLKRGSEVAVVVMGSGAKTLTDKPSYDPAAVSKLIADVEPVYGPIDTEAALDAATAILADATNAKRDLLLVSDFQSNDWAETESAARRRLGELPVQPSVTFLRVGDEAGDNVAVESIELSRPVVGVGQELRMRANVVNHSARKPVDNLRLHFRVDGEQKDIAQINLAPGEQRDVLFAHKFETPGSHLVRIDTVADELTADNEFTLAVSVLDRIPVLLVDGDPASEPLAGETDYLDIALRPYTASKKPGADGKLADLIEAKVVPAAKLTAKDLVGPRVVILANVARLDDALVEALRQFVQQGGGSLVVFPGNRIDVDWYNRVLAAGPAPLLPAPILAIAGDLNDTTKQAGVLAQHYDHPAMAIFNDSRNGDLTTTNVWLWYRFDLAKDAAAGTVDRKVLARLSTGDPLLIERPLGDGLVIAAASSVDADWSNLPLRPVYLPLVQQITTYAASRSSAPRNVAVDHPIVAMLEPDLAGKPFTLTDPAGKKHSLTASARERRAVVEFAQTRRPGVYKLEGPDGFAPLAFVVQAPRSESKVERLDEPRLAAAAKLMGADIVKDADAYAALDATRSHGREIWRTLLLAVLALLFGELLLQQYFTRQRN